MPRTGITEEQMAAAAIALQARNEPVTKITLRKELGDTGSYSTISAFLARWRQSQDHSEVLPTPIPEKIQNQFSLVWSMARSEALGEFVKEREAHAFELALLRQTYSESAGEANEAIRTLEAQIDDQATRLIELTTKELAAQLKATEQAERIGYLNAKVEDAENALCLAAEGGLTRPGRQNVKWWPLRWRSLFLSRTRTEAPKKLANT